MSAGPAPTTGPLGLVVLVSGSGSNLQALIDASAEPGATFRVLAVGAEKMRDVTSRGSLLAKTANQTHPTLAKGRTAPGQFALLATRSMHAYEVGLESLARVR